MERAKLDDGKIQELFNESAAAAAASEETTAPGGDIETETATEGGVEVKRATMKRIEELGRYKKWMFILRMISGLTVREAIAQLQFCAKKRAAKIALHLHKLSNRFRNMHGGDPYTAIVKVARADRGGKMRKVLDVKTPKTRGGIKKIWRSNITLTIENSSPRTTVSKERRLVAKAIEREKKGLPPARPFAISWLPTVTKTARKRDKSKWAKKAGLEEEY